MQVQEILNEKLGRAYKICVPAAHITAKTDAFLAQKAKTFKLPGFRPGRVPLPLLKQHFLPEALQRAISQSIQEGCDYVVKTFQLNPVFSPEYTLENFEEGKDLEYRVHLDVFPEVPEISWTDLSFQVYQPVIDPEKIEALLTQQAAATKTSRKIDPPRPAQAGDTVIVDLEMSVAGGAEVETKEDMPILLEEGAFAGDLIQQLIGKRSGDIVEAPWSIPQNFLKKKQKSLHYLVKFTIKDVCETVPFEVCEAFAQHMGFENLEALRAAVRQELQQNADHLAFLFVKRQFLDYLALKYPFDVPQKMVDKEFSTIWNQMLSAWGLLPPSAEKERAGWVEKTPEERAAVFQKEAEKTEPELKEDYQRIAERRVRLGLILAEIGKREKIALSAEEVAAVIREKSKEFPGQEAEAARYYRENQQANMALQAPLFEKKIVEFALSTASCEKREISFSQLEELFEKDDVNF